MNLYKYLFGFKIEFLIDRLIGNAKILINVLEQRFIYEYFRKNIQLAGLKANTLTKRCYDAIYRWEKFEVDDQV